MQAALDSRTLFPTYKIRLQAKGLICSKRKVSHITKSEHEGTQCTLW